MVVVGAGSHDFIAGHAVREVDFHGEPSIAEELERTIDRGLPDAFVQLLDMLVELLQRVVSRILEKGTGYDASLGGDVEAVAIHEVQKLLKFSVAVFPLLLHASLQMGREFRAGRRTFVSSPLSKAGGMPRQLTASKEKLSL